MYVHVGEDVLIRSKEIIAILNKDSFDDLKGFPEFENRYGNKIFNVSKGEFKSVVVTDNNIYLSPFVSLKILKHTK
ncbi:extracellular matrix regulator RemB [Cytobacillus sp. Hz8]|uniref:extracellular matrix regulator RemB n=1 Tax=Cytobacillus sp. Hz8 TaxID=3347168 RepID=UPI0035DBE814